MIKAMRSWAALHGGVPPTTSDWRYRGKGHPVATCAVIKRVGWNALVLRAGFELRRDRRPQTQEQMEAMLREGLSVQEIADHFGVSTSNLYQRMSRRGLRVSEMRPG